MRKSLFSKIYLLSAVISNGCWDTIPKREILWIPKQVKLTNKEFNEQFRKRTLAFALKVIEFLETVPFNSATRVMSFQLCKAATSVGANFRAFCRSRSGNEHFSKICIVVEEADESVYWLKLFDLSNYGDKDLLAFLIPESIEITKITTSIKHSISKY